MIKYITLFLKINFIGNICFAILCYFLLYSKVNQLYIYSLFFGSPSHLVTIKDWVDFLVLYSRFSLAVCFIQSCWIHISIPISQFIPSLFPLVSIYLFSISVSLFHKISSSTSFSYIPHISNIIYLFFSFWLKSQCMTVFISIHVFAHGKTAFLFMSE